MRVVIDTNIIVSAYLGGLLENVLRSFKEGKFSLIVSKAIVDEYLTEPNFLRGRFFIV